MADAAEALLLTGAIDRVWNEREPVRRLAAIAELYHPDARIHEPARTVTGHAAISDVVGSVLADMPPGFRFAVTGPTFGHHGVAVTRWQGGPPGGVTVSGADAVQIVDGQIRDHWFFFDPTD